MLYLAWIHNKNSQDIVRNASRNVVSVARPAEVFTLPISIAKQSH